MFIKTVKRNALNSFVLARRHTGACFHHRESMYAGKLETTNIFNVHIFTYILQSRSSNNYIMYEPISVDILSTSCRRVRTHPTKYGRYAEIQNCIFITFRLRKMKKKKLIEADETYIY
jgi:hypothetical protein